MQFFYPRLETGLFCLLLTFAAAGQEHDEGKISIHVSATVINISSVEIVTLQHISLRGGSRLTGKLYISPLTDANAGLVQLKGKPGSVARVSCLLTEELQEKNGNGRIFIRYRLSGHPERIQHAARLIDTGEINITFNEKGIYYLWIGGQVDLTRAFPGTYTGQFTLEVEYI
jgi:hypothetical protein